MAFAQLNTRGDDEPDIKVGPEEELASAEAPAAEVETTNAAAAPKRPPARGFSSLLRHASDEPDLPLPGEDEPTPAVAAKDEFDELADLVPAQPAPSIDEDGRAAGNGGPAEPGGATAGDAEDKPEAEQDELQLQEEIRKFAEENGVSIEAARERVLAHRQAMVEEAARRSGASPEDVERALQNEQNAAAQMMRGGGSGGGAVAALVGGIASMFKGGARATSKAYNATIADRIYRHRYDAFHAGVEEMRSAGRDLKAGVKEFNAAFLNSEAASRLRELAKAEGKDFDGYLSDLNSGKLDSPEAKAALNDAMSEPEVAAAWSRVSEAEQKLAVATGTAERNMDKLAMAHSDRFQTDAEVGKFRKAGEEATEGLDPVVKNEETKKLMKRIEEMMENIRRIVERIVERVSGLFRR